jgi:protein subunit release factor A
VFPIDNRIDWNAIRAEYIGGGISQRKLAEKHGVPWPTLRDRASREKWQKKANEARYDAVTKAVQETASTAAENATIAADIQKRLLLRLKRTEAKFPMDATEIKATEGGKTVVYRLRDLAEMYQRLTANITPSGTDEILKNARALLEGVDSAID